MSLEQALQLLDQLTSQMNLPRATHAQVLEALKILTALVQEKKLESK
jgi:hypothetical protein